MLHFRRWKRSKSSKRRLFSTISTTLVGQSSAELNLDSTPFVSFVLGFSDCLYAAYQTSPLGRTILGPEENIKNMTREHIINYIQVWPTQKRIWTLWRVGVCDKLESIQPC
jgi:hypothetical protein